MDALKELFNKKSDHNESLLLCGLNAIKYERMEGVPNGPSMAKMAKGGLSTIKSMIK